MLNRLKNFLRPLVHASRIIAIYIIFPIIIVGVFLYVSYLYDPTDWLPRAFTSFQMFAVVIGGIWGYRSFGKEKRFDGLKELHLSLINYDKALGELCDKYRSKDLNIVNFKFALFSLYRLLVLKVLHTYALRPRLKRKILNTIANPVFNLKNDAEFVDVIGSYEKRLQLIIKKIAFLLEQSY